MEEAEKLKLIDEYIQHGWSLAPVPPGRKGPTEDNWNLKQNELSASFMLPSNYGVGLMHAYSGTAALDIDDWEKTDKLFTRLGISLEILKNKPDSVMISSGRPGRGKFLFRMPDGLILNSKQVNVEKCSAYNFRCSTSNDRTMQDMLPPSVHPVTNEPYTWVGNGDWRELPMIPNALLDHWESLLVTERHDIKIDDSRFTSWEEITTALTFIDPDTPRNDWVSIGMAIHHYATEINQLNEGLITWDAWSSTAKEKYKGKTEIISQWNSFRSNKLSTVKIGTLFHLAKQGGWVPPAPDLSGLFQSVVPDDADSIVAHFNPAPPKVDLSLFPDMLATRAREISESVSCDPLVPLFAGLSTISGAVDARIRLELIEGFQVPPILWLMTIGDPGIKKTPGSRPMMEIIKQLELEDQPRFKKEFLAWEGIEAAHNASHKNYIEFSASPDALLRLNEAPEVLELPPQPVPLKIVVSDITSQKLVRHASLRPRGLLCYLDEMSSWVRKMTDKSSGEDRSTWVVSYESNKYDMDRVGGGSIYCENLAVSIFGNIQPEVFRSNLTALSQDGLLQRFIPAILSRRPGVGNPIPEFLTNKSKWDQVVRLAAALPSMTYKLSPDAFVEFREFQHWYEQTIHDEALLLSPTLFMTALSKIEGTCGRFILLFHLIENPFLPFVNKETVQRVVEIVKGFIIPSFRYAFIDMVETDSFDLWVKDHIVQNCNLPSITLAEIKKSGRRQLDKVNPWVMDRMVMNAMFTLEKAKWVVRIDDGSREHVHFAEWAIHPGLEERIRDHRIEVKEAKERQFKKFFTRRSKGED